MFDYNMFELIGIWLLCACGIVNIIISVKFDLEEKKYDEARREEERNMTAEEKRIKREEKQKKADVFEIETSMHLLNYKYQAVEFLWSYFSMQSAGVKWRPVTEDTLLKFKEMINKTRLEGDEK